MKTLAFPLGPLLIFALLVELTQTASSAVTSKKTVHIHTIDAAQITLFPGESDDEDPL